MLSLPLSLFLLYAKIVGIDRYKGPSPSSSDFAPGTNVVFREPQPWKQKPRRNQLALLFRWTTRNLLRNGGARFLGVQREWNVKRAD